MKPSHGQIAFRLGGCSAAALYCAIARYETPSIPTLPVDQVWAPAHSISSTMSAASASLNSEPTPSEVPAPRRSALITAYPCETHHTGSGASHPVSLEMCTGSGWFMMRYWRFSDQPRRVRCGWLSLP